MVFVQRLSGLALAFDVLRPSTISDRKVHRSIARQCLSSETAKLYVWDGVSMEQEVIVGMLTIRYSGSPTKDKKAPK